MQPGCTKLIDMCKTLSTKEHTIDVEDGVEKLTINIEKKKPEQKAMLLRDVLPLVTGDIRLTVSEKVCSKDKMCSWHVDMPSGSEMLDFIENHTRLVDGPLLLNCDIDVIKPTGRDIAAGGLLTKTDLRTEIVVVMGED